MQEPRRSHTGAKNTSEARKLRQIATDDLKCQVKILKKPPEQRTSDELRKLAATFSQIKFFKGLEISMMMQLCGVLQLEHWPADRIVFKEGERGDKFYMILAGSVSVYIQNIHATDVEVRQDEPRPSELQQDKRSPLLRRFVGLTRQMRESQIMKVAAEHGEGDSALSSQSADDMERKKNAILRNKRVKDRMRMLLGIMPSESKDTHLSLMEAAEQSIDRAQQRQEEEDRQAEEEEALQLRKQKVLQPFQAAVARIGVGVSLMNQVSRVRRLREEIEGESDTRSSLLRLELQSKGDLHMPTALDANRQSVLEFSSLSKAESTSARWKDSSPSGKGQGALTKRGQRNAKLAANVHFAEPSPPSTSSSSSSSRSASSVLSSGSRSRSSSLGGSSGDELHNSTPRLEDVIDVQPAEELSEKDQEDESVQSADEEEASPEERGHRGSRSDSLLVQSKRASAAGAESIIKRGSAEVTVKRASGVESAVKRASAGSAVARASAGSIAARASAESSHLTQEQVLALAQGTSSHHEHRASHRGSIESAGSRRDSVLSLDPDFIPATDTGRRPALVPLSPTNISLGKPQEGKRRRSRRSITMLCEVGKLPAGSAFGEVALQNDLPRSATIKTNENSYFAVLTREDYRRIFLDTVELQKKKLMEFIQQVPLLSGLSPQKFAKLTAMMQHREVKKNEVICGPDSVVLQVYIVHEGEFAVMRDDPGAAGEEEIEEHEQLALSFQETGAATFLKRQNQRSPITSLVVAPQIFGLTAYLRSEKKYRERVVCHSATGSVYCILAKELVSHLPRETRSRLLVAAHAQKRFYDNRSAVLHGLQPQPLREKDRPGRCKGSRRWPEEESFQERLTRITGKAIDHSSLSVYAPADRLRIIGAVFRNSDQPTEQLPAESNTDTTADSKQTAGKTVALVEGRSSTPVEVEENKPCWWIEGVARAEKLEEEHFSWPPKEKELQVTETGALQVLSRFLGTHSVPSAAAVRENAPDMQNVSELSAKAAEEEAKKELEMMQRFKATKTLHYMGPRLQMRNLRPAPGPGRAATSAAVHSQHLRLNNSPSVLRMSHSISAPNLHSRSVESSPTPLLGRNRSEPNLLRDIERKAINRWMMRKGGARTTTPWLESLDENHSGDSFHDASPENEVGIFSPSPVTWKPPDMRFFVEDADTHTLKACGEEEIVLLLQRAEEVAAARRAQGFLYQKSQSSTMGSSENPTSRRSSLGHTASSRVKWGISSSSPPPAQAEADTHIGTIADEASTSKCLPQLTAQTAEARISQLPTLTIARDMFSADLLKTCGRQAQGAAQHGAKGGSCTLPAVSLGQIYSHPFFDAPGCATRGDGNSSTSAAAAAVGMNAASPRSFQGGPGGSRWCIATPLPEIKSTRGTKWNRVGFDRGWGAMRA